MEASTPRDLTVSQQFCSFLSGLDFETLPQLSLEVAMRDLVDMAGLCVAARNEVYVRQLVDAWDSEGPCTAIGQSRALDAAGAATINGVATHGEDFDDTLEGAPIRVGAMVIPAVLAVAERFGLSGERALVGIVAGLEAVCRLNRVAPGHMHKAGFHPVGVIGALGSAAGVGAALGLDRDRLAMALGIASSMASGILEYLTDGAWTKRLHPGWAAQSGLKAALMARAGFFGPLTALEGHHGLYHSFAPTGEPNFSHLTDGLGENWHMQRIAFKPYACGTMIHPYIDCMIELGREGIDAEAISSITCETGEGLVHRLWEPLADKHRPPSGYAAKFSMPFCMAVGFFDGDAGLAQFTDERARDEKVLKLARKISYVIDPDNEYPANYTGHVRLEMAHGTVIERRRPHMRGGAREPLTRDEIVTKFRTNVAHGGWAPERGDALLAFCETLVEARDLADLAAFRA